MGESKIMKIINKLIKKKCIEIMIAATIIIVSFPLWQSMDIGDYTATAAFYNEAQYTYLNITDNQINNLYPIKTDNAIKNLKKSKIEIINDTKTSEEYSLLLKIEKNSTLDYNVLNIALNDSVHPLKDLLIVEDANNYYFSLYTNSIVGKKETLSFIMWMDEKTGNEMQNKTLNYSFELQKGIKI